MKGFGARKNVAIVLGLHQRQKTHIKPQLKVDRVPAGLQVMESSGKYSHEAAGNQ